MIGQIFSLWPGRTAPIRIANLPLVLAAFVATASAEPARIHYRSPYSVHFKYPFSELVGDIVHTRRGDPHESSSIPFHQWDSERVRREFGAWGPPAKHYPAPRDVEHRPVEWKRERVVAVALRFVGYGYQHHHIPDWDPPHHWPWKECCVGHNGKGVDCSNFTAFVYNLGFGIKPSGGIAEQAREIELAGPGEDRRTRVRVLHSPGSYAGLVNTLRSGDLLYIRNDRGELAHVILWVGPIGASPDNTPLIIDSHGGAVKDSRGVAIPCGIHLRPFHEDSWYFRSFSHAHRIFAE